MLVDHADAPRDRVGRAGDRGHLPIEQDLALVGSRQAVQDVHERRLARTVLAEEGVDLVLADDEVDAMQRGEVAEALHDAAHLDVWDELISHA